MDTNAFLGFVPQSEWPTLHELCHGFDEHQYLESEALSGSSLSLMHADQRVIHYHFQSANDLTWSATRGDKAGVQNQAVYKAFEIRTNIFFIDFQNSACQEEVTIVVDLSCGGAIVATSGFHLVDEKKRTITTFSDACVEGHDGASGYALTSELIGKHILYRYTEKDAYEHIYHNQGTFTWHCLGGTEQGMADAEPCKMLKLSDELYLLFWSEKIMPVESVVVIDLKVMRSCGRFLCWDPKPQKAVHTIFGSYATLLGDVDVQSFLARPLPEELIIRRHEWKLVVYPLCIKRPQRQ